VTLALELAMDLAVLGFLVPFDCQEHVGLPDVNYIGTFYAFNFDKYARRYLGGHCFRFNRRFSLAEITERIANAVWYCKHCTDRDLRVAEIYG
jgi:hypothetical protein